MTWLHTWTGLILGWLLFAVFLTGTVSFFQFEITRWMKPELEYPASAENAVAQAQAFLSDKAPNSSRWSISVPSSRETLTTLFWRDPDAGPRGFQRATLDGNGNEVATRETRGGSFLYRFHFDLHYMPVLWARWLVGIAAMCMLVAIVSGVIIHKKIFKDFFTFKTGPGVRSWLDAHTLTSVLALPFHFMITYTGLVTLMLMYFVWAINLSHGDRNALFNALNSGSDIPKAAGVQVKTTDLQAVYLDAKARLDSGNISFISVTHPGDKNGVVELNEAATHNMISSYGKLRYSSYSGELLSATPVTSLAEQTRRTMINLHAGRFADWQLRWLYFISGIAGSLMIATGLVLWLKKREKRQVHFGHKLVSGLNFGALMGLPFAIACYFAANRLLPVDLEDRAQMEIHLFFAAWVSMLIFGLLRHRESRWYEGAILISLTFLSLPFLSAFMVQKHIGSYNMPADATLLYVDFAILITSMVFAIQSVLLHKKRVKVQEVHCAPAK